MVGAAADAAVIDHLGAPGLATAILRRRGERVGVEEQQGHHTHGGPHCRC